MIIGLMCLFYNKCNNLVFKINNKTFGPLLHDVAFLAVDYTAKTIRL